MRYFFSAIGLFVNSVAIADSTLPPVVVSATRSAEPGIDIPAAKTVITRDVIENSAARDLPDLLRRVGSIHVSDSIGDGSSANLDMRGFGSTAQSNVAVLIDGRKINPATDSATLYLNSIDLDQVEQIEVIEGSAGTLYGNQAVGGLINIITRDTTKSGRYLRLGAGSYDAWEIAAGGSESIAPDVSLGIDVQRRDSDNYRDRSDSKLERLSSRLDVQHGGGRSYLEVQLLRDDVQTPGALLASEVAQDRRQAAFDGDYLDTDSDLLLVGTKQQLNPTWRLEGELAWRDDRRNFVQSFRGFPGTPSSQDRESVEFTPRLVGRAGPSVYTIGFDYLTTDYMLDTAFGRQGDDQQIGAVYAQITHDVRPDLALTVGVRHAWVDNAIDNNGSDVDIDDDVTVGSFGLVYRPTANWRMFLRADQNYRFAKVDEHTNVPFGQPIGLDTQRGVSYESGVSVGTDRVNASLRAYQLRLKDEISFDAVSFTNVNLPRSRRNGAAISFDLKPIDQFGLGASYEYIDSEITSGNHAGSEVPLVPEHRAGLYAEYLPDSHWLLRVDVEYVGEQYLGSDYANSAPPLDDYTVVDLVAHYDYRDWRFTAKINNLLDEKYSETGSSSFAGNGYNPAPERNLWFGVSYSFRE